MKIYYTREDLIKICEQSFVPESKWKNRDSENAQCKVGECYALLRAGCEFEIIYKDNYDIGLVTNEDTIWLKVYSEGFEWFEGYGTKEEHHYYLPTQKKLDVANGKDWY